MLERWKLEAKQRRLTRSIMGFLDYTVAVFIYLAGCSVCGHRFGMKSWSHLMNAPSIAWTAERSQLDHENFMKSAWARRKDGACTLGPNPCKFKHVPGAKELRYHAGDAWATPVGNLRSKNGSPRAC